MKLVKAASTSSNLQVPYIMNSNFAPPEERQNGHSHGPKRLAPAYPLITHDPYFSIWSFSDGINEDPSRHWSGKEHSLLGMIKVDQITYKFLGDFPGEIKDVSVQNAVQTKVTITATQTIYHLECGSVEVCLGFTSPLLLDDLEILARPVSYVSIKTRSLDTKPHNVQVYFGASAGIAANEPGQAMTAGKFSAENLTYLRTGTFEQPILEKSGDDLRIDWGYLYVAAPVEAGVQQFVSTPNDAITGFLRNDLPCGLQFGDHLLLSTVFPSEEIVEEKEHLMLVGYNDTYAINYFGTQLRSWWNKNEDTLFEEVLEDAFNQYEAIVSKCKAFDTHLYNAAVTHGGESYARLLELGYRQAIAAHKLVESKQGEILFLSKENFSNGSINTVDVTYPSAPLFLLYNVDLLKGMMNGIFYYTESGLWQKPFPAHDLGTYPLATGQTYHEDMPVEEAGNMLILTAAIVKAEGDAQYAAAHWESLSTWVKFLTEEGFDPDKQLCTDDFAGHLARNANLSIKAIVAIGSYGYMAKELGKLEEAEEYLEIARSMAEMWMVLADAGDHYALTFNDKNTWSQKYNLVWDKLLDLEIFPAEVYEKEMAWYHTKMNTYGLPLDNRADYTKSDWVLWIASLAGSKEEFEKFVDPIYKFALETQDRVPLTDWHYTSRNKMEGFQARSVVGGFFLKLLAEKWKKPSKIKAEKEEEVLSLEN